MKSCSVFFALVCIGVCYVNSETITVYGNVEGQVMNIENLFAEREMFKMQNLTVTLPRVNILSNRKSYDLPFYFILINFIPLFSQTTWPFIITGIRHIDHKFIPVVTTILDGGIGHESVTLNVHSQRGFG